MTGESLRTAIRQKGARARTRALLVLLAITASSCLPVSVGSGSITSAAGGSTTTSTATTVTVSPNQQTISPGSSLQLSATGGTAPYTYSLITGQGSVVGSTGVFTANSTLTESTSSVEIAATDATGLVGYATVTVAYPPIVISPLSVTVGISSVFVFTATGGSGTYTFGLAYGAGSTYGSSNCVSTALGGIVPASLVPTSNSIPYCSGSSSSSDQLVVTDSNGDEAFASITVGSGGTSNTSSNSLCSLITAVSDEGVSMTCDSSEILGTYGQSGACGSTSTTGTSGTSSYSVGCGTSTTTATGSAYCCASPSRLSGSSYTRTISGSGTTYFQLYCGVGETILSASATCTTTGSQVPTNLPDNSAGQQGYSVNCTTATDTATLSVECQGVTPTY